MLSMVMLNLFIYRTTPYKIVSFNFQVIAIEQIANEMLTLKVKAFVTYANICL